MLAADDDQHGFARRASRRRAPFTREQSDLAEPRSRPEGADHLLPPGLRRHDDLDVAARDDEKLVADLAHAEDRLARIEPPHSRSGREPRQGVVRKIEEQRRSPRRRDDIGHAATRVVRLRTRSPRIRDKL
jgi:hypothetical protein